MNERVEIEKKLNDFLNIEDIDSFCSFSILESISRNGISKILDNSLPIVVFPVPENPIKYMIESRIINL